MALRLSFFGLSTAALVVACGARSPLAIDDTPITPNDAGLSADTSVPTRLPPPRDASVPDVAPPPGPDAATCPTSCDDGIACTVDGCDEKTLACTHRPDDSLCPDGLKCDGVSGCAKIVYAVTGGLHGALYEVTLPTGATRTLNASLFAGDVALMPDGTLYVADNSLNRVDRITGKVLSSTWIQTPGEVVALDAAPDGTLYGGNSGDPSIYRIDPATGDTKPVVSLPTGYIVSGDIAFTNGRLFATAKRSYREPTDTLVELHPDTGAAQIVGDIGFPCVWGLATFQSTLYGLTCEGHIITIDLSSGVGTLSTTVGLSFNGATSR